MKSMNEINEKTIRNKTNKIENGIFFSHEKVLQWKNALNVYSRKKKSLVEFQGKKFVFKCGMLNGHLERQKSIESNYMRERERE